MDNNFKILIDPVPQNCSECPLYADKDWDDLRDYCHLTGEDVWSSEYKTRRHEKCPLYIRNESVGMERIEKLDEFKAIGNIQAMH